MVSEGSPPQPILHSSKCIFSGASLLCASFFIRLHYMAFAWVRCAHCCPWLLLHFLFFVVVVVSIDNEAASWFFGRGSVFSCLFLFVIKCFVASFLSDAS